jgi:hypothetical protein
MVRATMINVLPLAAITLTFAVLEAGASDSPPAKQADNNITAATSTQRLLRGVDADGDGIRDDVASLVDADSKTASKTTTTSKVRSELDDALANSGPPRVEAPRRTCLDYLLLEPKDQAAANRYLQGRTHGTFGTHPCDPIASPLLERPFDTDVAVVPLGPVKVQYAKHE